MSGGPPWSGPEALELPTCVRAEAVDHQSGVMQFSFDAEGNLTQAVDADNAGVELARTTVTWTPVEVVVVRTGALAFEQRGTLGPHGELLALRGSDQTSATLEWNGTFAPATSPATARFQLETFYHLTSPEVLLPFDTAARGVWPRMRAFVFTGTAVVRHGSGRVRA